MPAQLHTPNPRVCLARIKTEKSSSSSEHVSMIVIDTVYNALVERGNKTIVSHTQYNMMDSCTNLHYVSHMANG